MTLYMSVLLVATSLITCCEPLLVPHAMPACVLHQLQVSLY